MLGALCLTLYSAAITPLIMARPLEAGSLAIPLVLGMLALAVRRGRDIGITGTATVSLFVVATWSAEIIAMNFPAVSSVRMLPLLTLTVLPGQAGAFFTFTHGSNRTVQ